MFTVSVFAACERQILELCILQIHFHIWRYERSGDGGDSSVVCLVFGSWLHAYTGTALQGSL